MPALSIDGAAQPCERGGKLEFYTIERCVAVAFCPRRGRVATAGIRHRSRGVPDGEKRADDDPQTADRTCGSKSQKLRHRMSLRNTKKDVRSSSVLAAPNPVSHSHNERDVNGTRVASGGCSR